MIPSQAQSTHERDNCLSSSMGFGENSAFQTSKVTLRISPFFPWITQAAGYDPFEDHVFSPNCDRPLYRAYIDNTYDCIESRHTSSDPLEPSSAQEYQPPSFSSLSFLRHDSTFPSCPDLRSKSPNLASTLPVPLFGICNHRTRNQTNNPPTYQSCKAHLHKHVTIPQRHRKLQLLAGRSLTQKIICPILLLQLPQTPKHTRLLQERDRIAHLLRDVEGRSSKIPKRAIKMFLKKPLVIAVKHQRAPPPKAIMIPAFGRHRTVATTFRTLRNEWGLGKPFRLEVARGVLVIVDHTRDQ